MHFLCITYCYAAVLYIYGYILVFSLIYILILLDNLSSVKTFYLVCFKIYKYGQIVWTKRFAIT